MAVAMEEPLDEESALQVAPCRSNRNGRLRPLSGRIVSTLESDIVLIYI